MTSHIRDACMHQSPRTSAYSVGSL